MLERAVKKSFVTFRGPSLYLNNLSRCTSLIRMKITDKITKQRIKFQKVSNIGKVKRKKMQNYGFNICEKESKDQQRDEQTIHNCHCMHDFFLILHSAFSISINLTYCWVLNSSFCTYIYLVFFPLLSEDPVCCSLSTSVCPPPQNGEFVLFVGWGGVVQRRMYKGCM